MSKSTYGLYYKAELIGTWDSLARARAWADANNRMYARHGHGQYWSAKKLTKQEQVNA